ncbi:MAG: hypothetical protein JNK09_19765 [Prolixibacteraceae bacterium]|nr:hypothetical protein [Prolixibacteraceae bacterium]
MESVKFQKLTNEQGLITHLKVGGLLVVEHAQYIKKELVDTLGNLNDSVEIQICEVDDIDISFIQLIIAYTKRVAENGIKFHLKWELEEDQRLLFENVGLSYELFIND